MCFKKIKKRAEEKRLGKETVDLLWMLAWIQRYAAMIEDISDNYPEKQEEIIAQCKSLTENAYVLSDLCFGDRTFVHKIKIR